MAASRPKLSRALIAAQIGSVLLVFLCIALAPPAEGNMLLIPIARLSEARVIGLAAAEGATVVQRGPLSSSVIVYGKRDRLFAPLARAGVLMVAGGAVGCRAEAPAA